jgi:hypothetical protein
MSIHEHQTPGEKTAEGIGMGKGDRVRQTGQEASFDCAIWLHRACHRPQEDFKKAEKELPGRETEPWEIIYFKLYQAR